MQILGLGETEEPPSGALILESKFPRDLLGVTASVPVRLCPEVNTVLRGPWPWRLGCGL